MLGVIACEAEGQGQVLRSTSQSSNSSGQSSSVSTVAPDSISRLAVTLLGELVEPGFEAVFVSMYDHQDRPTFEYGTMQLEFRDSLDRILYSRTVTITSAAQWGPTLDGSEGAMLKAPISDFESGFPGNLFVDVSYKGSSGSAQAKHVEEYISWTSIPVMAGESLRALIDTRWLESHHQIEGELFGVGNDFFGDSFSMVFTSYGCSFGQDNYGVSDSPMFRLDFAASTEGGGVKELYIPSTFIDDGTSTL